MSTAPLPMPFYCQVTQTATPPGGLFEREPGPPVRRRGNFEQGRALELLGHAIEYLSDSRMFFEADSMPQARAQADAIQIMMRASRAVFEECPETVSLRRKVGRWITQRLTGPGH